MCAGTVLHTVDTDSRQDDKHYSPDKVHQLINLVEARKRKKKNTDVLEFFPLKLYYRDLFATLYAMCSELGAVGN